jgi:hypothetical protein
MNFRQAAGRQISWDNTGVETGFSNFSFVESKYGSNPVLRRIFSQARKHNYQSVLVEEIAEADCALLAEENQTLALRQPDFQKSVAHRISFFRSPVGKTPGNSDFLGYVVFKRDFFASRSGKSIDHIFESVMLPCRSAEQNNFIHCARGYEVSTTLGQFRVTGVLYAQQNDCTFVCAHVALRTVIASILPDADISYTRLNSLAGVDHKNHRVGDGIGLTPQQIDQILTGLNLDFDKLIHEPSKQLTLPTEYQRHLYGYVESGTPALVGFELDATTSGNISVPRHAIPVFGHTFNEDAWLPEAQRAYFGGKLSYYPSENWLSTFVMHDDNFGPYFCLPRHFLKKDNFRLLYGLKVCPTIFNAVDAEAIGLAFCEAISKRYPRLNHDWYDRFSVYARQGWLVLRALLVRKNAYLRHIKEAESREHIHLEPDIQQRLGQLLPPHFWMVEASAPELFSTTRRKFGEILLTTDKPAKPLSTSLLFAARLPGLLFLNPGSGSLAIIKTQLRSHTPIYSTTSNH